ncbi:MAG: nucleotidyltransferase domain-containing protein [bacterium]
MSPRLAIPLPLDLLTDFCRQHGIARLEVFGSILREDFGPESDIDFLYTFAPGAIKGVSIMDIVRWEFELGDLLGRKVDLTDRVGIEESFNPYRKQAILESAEVLLDFAQAA